jgi:co-chaperonin GroES (HSP10)
MQNFDPAKIRPLWNRVLIEEDAKPTLSEGGTIILQRSSPLVEASS